MAEKNYFEGRAAEYYPGIAPGRTGSEKKKSKQHRALMQKNLPILERYLQGDPLDAKDLSSLKLHFSDKSGKLMSPTAIIKQGRDRNKPGGFQLGGPGIISWDKGETYDAETARIQDQATVLREANKERIKKAQEQADEDALGTGGVSSPPKFFGTNPAPSPSPATATAPAPSPSPAPAPSPSPSPSPAPPPTELTPEQKLYRDAFPSLQNKNTTSSASSGSGVGIPQQQQEIAKRLAGKKDPASELLAQKDKIAAIRANVRGAREVQAEKERGEGRAWLNELLDDPRRWKHTGASASGEGRTINRLMTGDPSGRRDILSDTARQGRRDRDRFLNKAKKRRDKQKRKGNKPVAMNTRGSSNLPEQYA